MELTTSIVSGLFDQPLGRLLGLSPAIEAFFLLVEGILSINAYMLSR